MANNLTSSPNQSDNMWENIADFYNKMAGMEKEFTLNQINCFDTSLEDTVLDIGCGPGRITVPMALRAKSVTAIDTAYNMLAHCEANAKAAGVTNLTPKYLDWRTAELGQDLEQHDIVIACRSVGLYDIEKLIQFAKKYVVLISWANAPSIPEVVGSLFKGTSEELIAPNVKVTEDDRRFSYNLRYNMVYDMGYEPNINIVEDGFEKTFSTREEAYADLRSLKPNLPDSEMEIFRNNVDEFLTENNDGTIKFLFKTRSYVLWWKI